MSCIAMQNFFTHEMLILIVTGLQDPPHWSGMMTEMIYDMFEKKKKFGRSSWPEEDTP